VGQTAGGDGGQSGFQRSESEYPLPHLLCPQVFVNFRATNTLGWIGSHRSSCTAEGWSFYVPSSTTQPCQGRSTSSDCREFGGTTDNGGAQAGLDLHCNKLHRRLSVICGDFVELGSSHRHYDPTEGDSALGSDRTGGVVAAIGRAPSDKSTMWAATTTDVFYIQERDDVSNVAGADGSGVTYTRLDSTSAAAQTGAH